MYSYLELENKSFEDFYFKFCGKQKCEPHYYYGPAVRSHYLLHVCTDGKGEYHINNKIYKIKKGDIFLIPPHVVTFYQADEIDPWSYLWIGFDGKKASLYLKRCCFDEEHLVIHSEDIEQLTKIINSMLEHHKLSYSNEFFIQSLLFQFFAYLNKSISFDKKENTKSNNIYITKAIEYIQNNYQNSITVYEIANYLSLNRSYLTALFKKHLHLSPQEFLLRYRMIQAENLLISTSLPINQIAYSCGYSNQLSFSKAFHHTHNQSPREFRNQQQAKTKRTIDPHQQK